MKGLKIGIIALVISAFVVGAYLLGASNSSVPLQVISNEPKNLEEIAKLDSEFIQTMKLNLELDKSDNQVQSTEISDRLEELNGRLLETKVSSASADVPFPLDSPAGKLRSQPRTESGIPVSVLRNYEKETGVSPGEVEELMRRTN